MIRRPPRSTRVRSSAASDVYKRQPQATDVLLDIATGGGHVARVIGPHVGKVIVSDLTPQMLDHAVPYLQQQGLVNIERLVADAQDLPLDGASVDIVTCRIAPHLSLIHISEP